MYKMPIQRRKAARRLASALASHGDLIAERLEPRMAKVLREGEEMPDVAHVLDVLGRVVMAESEELDERDDTRSSQGARARRLGRELKEARHDLRARVVEIRRRMVHLYGAKKTQRRLQHKGRTPRNLENLEALADCMVRRLPCLGPPKGPGVSVDPAAWASFIRPALAKVQKLMKELEGRSWDEEDAVDVKQETMAAFDKTFRRVLRLGAIFYQLAGLDGLAEGLQYEGGRPPEQKKAARIA